MAKKPFSQVPTPIKALLITLGAVQVALTGAAHRDLSRRKPEEVNGSKGMWRAFTLVSFVGPIMYFRRGRQ